jgi:hypothetical protein
VNPGDCPGFRRLHGSLSLGKLRFVVLIFQSKQHIPFVHLLVVANFHLTNKTGHLRTERREIAAYKRVIRNLLARASFPCIPVAR